MKNCILSTVNILTIETQETTLLIYGMEASIPEGIINVWNSEYPLNCRRSEPL